MIEKKRATRKEIESKNFVSPLQHESRLSLVFQFDLKIPVIVVAIVVVNKSFIFQGITDCV